MKITKDSLHDVMFENHDARLLIEDVVTHTGANLYYYHGMEITVKKALDIWYKAMAADGEVPGENKRFSPGVFTSFIRDKIKEQLCCR